MADTALDAPLTPASWARASGASPLQAMLSAPMHPDTISLALGFPAADLFPTEDGHAAAQPGWTRASYQV